jgi:flavin reductase (DIM6/NTAB) family NADH-FMN oxidoreductase RutF
MRLIDPAAGYATPTMSGAAAFDELMGTLDHPMLIVTARAAQKRDGCLVGFASQVSIDPLRFLACLSVENRTFRLARRAERLAVHVVPAGAHDLAVLFGGETGDDTDKLARVAWDDGPAGLPILRRCPDWFTGRVERRIRLGDHVGFLLEPETVSHGRGGQLGSTEVGDIDAGHEA